MNITLLSNTQALIDDLARAADSLQRDVSGAIEIEVVRTLNPVAWLTSVERSAPARLRAVGVTNTGSERESGGNFTLPDVVLLEADVRAAETCEQFARLSRRYPQMSVILLASERSAELLLTAMRAGIREVLSLPLKAADLKMAFERAGARDIAGHESQTAGRVLGFVSCKGGSGATFIASNIAYALAANHQKRVLLIDLDLQYGDASFYFLNDARFPGSVAELAQNPHEIDATLLSASCLKVLPNLHVLSASENPEDAVQVTPAQIAKLLTAAAAAYDYVLFDMNRTIDQVSLKALDAAETVFVVMQSMVPDLRDARTMLRTFRELGYADQKLRFVVNRAAKKEDAPIKPIEKGLGFDFHRTIPNDFLNASTAVNQGVSIISLAPASPVSKALSEIAADIAGGVTRDEHWFRRLLRRA